MSLSQATLPPTPASASINRIRIVDLPGVPLDAEVRGESAYHLLSGPALIRYAQVAGDALALPEALRDGDPSSPEVRREVPRLVDARLAHPDPAVRRAALALARRLGRNLGYILLALRRGDAVNRAARPDWPDWAWDDWAGVRRILLGGGIVNGELGMAILDHANALLAGTGEADDGAVITVRRTPWPQNMAILGASRYLPAKPVPRWKALCLDLGQTSAKRAVVTIEDGTLTQLMWLPATPVRWRWRNDPTAGEAIDGADVLAFVATTLADGLTAGEARCGPLVRDVAVSIAAYTRGGTLLGNGIYARMHELGEDARSLIADRVAEICGVRPRLQIVHDGTAAAALHAGEARSAVIVVGTALGVGFPPASAAGLLGLSPDLVVNRQESPEV